MIKPNKPIAVPRLSLGNNIKSNVCMSGIMIPAPAACKIRPISIVVNSGATAQKTVPTAKMAIADRKSCLDVKRSIKNAVTGIIIPLTSMKIDCSHWAVFSSTFKSFMIGGSAVPRSVWFKIVINAPKSKTINNGMFCFILEVELSATYNPSFFLTFSRSEAKTLNHFC